MRTGSLRTIAKPARWAGSLRRLAGRLGRPVRHILGIACTGHGASIAYVGADGAIRSSVLDRWAGVKNTLMFAADEERSLREPQSDLDRAIHGLIASGFGRFPETRIFEQSFLPWLEWCLRDVGVSAADIDLVVASDSHFAVNSTRLGARLNAWLPSARIVRRIEHHAIHQRQAFWQSGFGEAAVLTLDTCGEDLPRLGGRKLAGTIAVMDERGECRVLKELLFPESSAGLIYEITNHHVGFRQGDEGKTMGLAPYGGQELLDQLRGRLRLDDDGGFTLMPGEEFKALLDRYVPARTPQGELTARHQNVAYAGQAILEAIVGNAFQAALRLSGSRNLAYAGGVALNSVANELAYRAARPGGLYIATNPGDSGHALGCALFGAHEVAGWPPRRCEVPEYLGPAYPPTELEATARSSSYPTERPAQLDEVVARCVANGHIIARFDGGAEFGPRALGNRSILGDPRRPDMKDYLNGRVKHREAFRPFAPTVLEERAAEWFELQGRSAYMLRVVPVRPERRERIPSVVHVDGTARVQTLAQAENPGYWSIIKAFDRLTGVPLVLNTSFNLAGKPIVETPADALACFEATQIDLLVLGASVVSKRPLGDYLREARP